MLPPDPPPDEPTKSDFFAVTVTKKDAEIERLTAQLQASEDSRKEERFGWIAALLAIVNYLLLKDVQNLIAPIIVFIMELMALLVLARRSQLEHVEILISKLIGSVTSRFHNGGDDA